MSMETDVAVLRTQMNELLNLIKGNGKPGLDERVRSIESKLNQHLDDDSEARQRREKEEALMMNDKQTKDERKWEMSKSMVILLVTVIVTQLAGLLVELLK
ncbi:MAG: hypothetical protein ABFD24_06185 [Anaerolineaceae bacterium]